MQNAAFPGVLLFRLHGLPGRLPRRKGFQKNHFYTPSGDEGEMPYTLRHLLHEWSFLPKTIPEKDLRQRL